jgi:hypothetical protein
MNKIFFEKGNLFDKFDETDLIIGMGSLGLSSLGTTARGFLRARRVSEKQYLEYDKVLSIEDKFMCFIEDDGLRIGGLSDEKLVRTLLKGLFHKASPTITNFICTQNYLKLCINVASKSA